MRHVSAHLARQISRQHGVVTGTQLRADGFTRDIVSRLVSRSVLIPLHQGVYRVATSPDTFESRCVAACAADPEAVITGVAAGRLWQFRHIFPVNVPEVLVAHHANPMSRGVTLRRTNELVNEDVVPRPDGIRVASPQRTWFDCAVHLDDAHFEMLTEHVLDHHCQTPTLWRITRRLEARGRRGLGRVRRVLSARAEWQRPLDSALEVRVLKALRRAGITELVRDHPIKLANNTIVHAAGALTGVKWAVEIDHVMWHGGRFDDNYVTSRDRAVGESGWEIVRVTDLALRADFAGEIDAVVAACRLRVAGKSRRTA